MDEEKIEDISTGLQILLTRAMEVDSPRELRELGYLYTSFLYNLYSAFRLSFLNSHKSVTDQETFAKDIASLTEEEMEFQQKLQASKRKSMPEVLKGIEDYLDKYVPTTNTEEKAKSNQEAKEKEFEAEKSAEAASSTPSSTSSASVSQKEASTNEETENEADEGEETTEPVKRYDDDYLGLSASSYPYAVDTTDAALKELSKNIKPKSTTPPVPNPEQPSELETPGFVRKDNQGTGGRKSEKDLL